jgi:hypothetical protein
VSADFPEAVDPAAVSAGSDSPAGSAAGYCLGVNQADSGPAASAGSDQPAHPVAESLVSSCLDSQESSSMASWSMAVSASLSTAASRATSVWWSTELWSSPAEAAVEEEVVVVQVEAAVAQAASRPGAVSGESALEAAPVADWEVHRLSAYRSCRRSRVRRECWRGLAKTTAAAPTAATRRSSKAAQNSG